MSSGGRLYAVLFVIEIEILFKICTFLCFGSIRTFQIIQGKDEAHATIDGNRKGGILRLGPELPSKMA